MKNKFELFHGIRIDFFKISSYAVFSWIFCCVTHRGEHLCSLSFFDLIITSLQLLRPFIGLKIKTKSKRMLNKPKILYILLCILFLHSACSSVKMSQKKTDYAELLSSKASSEIKMNALKQITHPEISVITSTAILNTKTHSLKNTKPQGINKNTDLSKKITKKNIANAPMTPQDPLVSKETSQIKEDQPTPPHRVMDWVGFVALGLVVAAYVAFFAFHAGILGSALLIVGIIAAVHSLRRCDDKDKYKGKFFPRLAAILGGIAFVSLLLFAAILGFAVAQFNKNK